MQPNELQSFYVLHTRAYRDTSLLLDCLTEQAGCISLVAKGAKRPKSGMRHILQPFIPLVGVWSGRGELATLIMAERAMPASSFLMGEKLFRALYVNELLIKLLARHDPCPPIFNAYHGLINGEFLEANLRCFEKKLLTELGYGLNLETDSQTHQPINNNEKYYFYPEWGCVNVAHAPQDNEAAIFIGSSLLAIAKDDYHSSAVLLDAKRLLRLSLQPLLGQRTLRSREFYQRIGID